MMIQLNPTIPMTCPKGPGYAVAMIDYSQEHDIFWVIAVTETGELWTFPNPEVRMQQNISLGRIFKKAVRSII